MSQASQSVMVADERPSRPIETEPTPPRHDPRRSDRVRARRVPRAAYFGVSAFWGFLVGVAALAVAASVAGAPLRAGAGWLAVLLPAVGVAVAGGAVVSAAYGEHRRRGH